MGRRSERCSDRSVGEICFLRWSLLSSWRGQNSPPLGSRKLILSQRSLSAVLVCEEERRNDKETYIGETSEINDPTHAVKAHHHQMHQEFVSNHQTERGHGRRREGEKAKDLRMSLRCLECMSTIHLLVHGEGVCEVSQQRHRGIAHESSNRITCNWFLFAIGD
jgi:hypothetical protein